MRDFGLEMQIEEERVKKVANMEGNKSRFNNFWSNWLLEKKTQCLHGLLMVLIWHGHLVCLFNTLLYQILVRLRAVPTCRANLVFLV